MTTKIIKQNQLTSECWNIQIWGLNACKDCEYKGTKNCGGKNILKKLKNDKGFKIPLN